MADIVQKMPKAGVLAHLPGIPDSLFFDPLPEEELKLWEGGECDCPTWVPSGDVPPKQSK